VPLQPNQAKGRREWLGLYLPVDLRNEGRQYGAGRSRCRGFLGADRATLLFPHRRCGCAGKNDDASFSASSTPTAPGVL
jgi:hypothetical protein